MIEAHPSAQPHSINKLGLKNWSHNFSSIAEDRNPTHSPFPPPQTQFLPYLLMLKIANKHFLLMNPAVAHNSFSTKCFKWMM